MKNTNTLKDHKITIRAKTTKICITQLMVNCSHVYLYYAVNG